MDRQAAFVQFPPFVTIATPMHTPLLRGNMAHGPYALGPLGANLRVRISRRDHQKIVAVCEAMGMRPAAFCRWSAVNVADQLTPYLKR